MESLERARYIGQELGDERLLSILDRAAAVRADRSKATIAIAGDYGVGKSTLISKLKLSGKKPADDDKAVDGLTQLYQMPFVEGASEEDGLLDKLQPVFEVRTEVIGDDTIYDRLADHTDKWFFVVNANHPFTANDVAAIKKLPQGRVVVILNRLDTIQEEDAEKLLNYAEGFCRKLHVEGPIVAGCDKADSELRSRMKEFIPQGEALMKARGDYAETLELAAVAISKIAVSKALEKNEEEREKARQESKNMGVLQKRAEWGAVKTSVIENTSVVAKNAHDMLAEKAPELTDYLMASGQKRGFSREWVENELHDQAVKGVRAIMGKYGPELEEYLNGEVNRLLEPIAELGVKYIPDYAPDVPGHQSFPEHIKLWLHGKISAVDALKMAGVTAVTLGGSILITASTALPSALSIGVIAIGAGKLTSMYGAAKATGWREAIGKCSQEIMDAQGKKLEDRVRDEFIALADMIGDAIAAYGAFDPTPFDEREAYLKGLLDK